MVTFPEWKAGGHFLTAQFEAGRLGRMLSRKLNAATLVSRIRSSPARSGRLLIGRHAENKDFNGPKLEFVTATNFIFGPLGRVCKRRL